MRTDIRGDGELPSRFAAPRRMPTAFGQAYGPRNVPEGVELPEGPERVSSIRIEVGADEAALVPLLPPGVRLAEPALVVQAGWFGNLRWLAGRGYNTLSVSVPVLAQTGTGELAADFLCVMWENLADPIITGRDDLGFPKVFADISVPDIAAGVPPTATVRASWQGTEFFAATISDPRPAPPGPGRRPVITQRYLPSVGDLTAAESQYLTITNEGSAESVQVLSSASATADLSFRHVTWQQVPFQFSIINALAAIDMTGPWTARVTCTEGYFTPATNRPLA